MNGNDIFDGITGIKDEFVEEALTYRFAHRRSMFIKWASAAAAVFVIGAGLFISQGIAPSTETSDFEGPEETTALEIFLENETEPAETLGGEAETGGLYPGEETASPSGFEPWDYNGPILPLTTGGSTDGIEAERHVELDFTDFSAPMYEAYSYAEVKDSYTLRNTTDSDITFTAVYPFIAGYIDLFNRPSLIPSVSGNETEAVLQAGSYCGSYAKDQYNSDSFSTWEDYADHFADGIDSFRRKDDYSALLEQTVTVYEVYNKTAQKFQGDEKIIIQFHYNPETTEFLTYYVNGLTDDPENGTYTCFINRHSEQSSFYGYSSYIIVLGEDADGYTINDSSLADIRQYSVTFEEILRTAIREDNEKHTLLYTDDDSYEKAYEIWNITEEIFVCSVTETLAKYGPFSDEPVIRFHSNRLDDIISDARGIRLMFLTLDITVPAGGETEIAFTMDKKSAISFTEAHSGWKGFDLAVTLGSHLNFTKQTASISGTEAVTIMEQDFGFDPENGVTEAELDLTEAHYRIDVKEKDGYRILPYDESPGRDEPADLYAATAADLSPYALPDKDQYNRASEGMYVFDVEGAAQSDPVVWYPVFRDGKIIRVFYGTGSEYTVAWQYATEATDAITALAHLTSEENPMYLVRYHAMMFAVIGDYAYCLPDSPFAPDDVILPEIDTSMAEVKVIKYAADEGAQ